AAPPSGENTHGVTLVGYTTPRHIVQTPEADTTAPRTFAKIDGVVVTQEEYLHQLERQTVTIPGGQPTNAERVVLDQIISNIVILREATKMGVLPSGEDVDRMFGVQEKLFTANFPGQSYDVSMREQGTTPEEIKRDLRIQLAETALYSKLMKLDESEVRTTYEKYQSAFGLPVRVQLRLIVAREKTPEFAMIKAALAGGRRFDDVAREMNPPTMRGTGGLLPQATTLDTVAPTLQSKIMKTAEGKFFGAVDFQQKGLKAWVKIEKKLPAYRIAFADAAPLVRRQLVQLKLQDSKYQSVKNDILQKKMQVSFEPEDKSYKTVWAAVKDAAASAGLGSATPGP
ncbi:MAG: SurA N-terminal domain-containing protein, partial [Akkermansiaceae bacterium]|nr:SurA N-terminal domain-containing protein [Armatimonadota bacterium]